MKSFAQLVLQSGGVIKPLLIDASLTKGTGLFNPSIFVTSQDEIIVNIRHCQYTLYHSESNIFEHPYGPLVYFNPENDITLTTTNYVGALDDNLEIEKIWKVDTSQFDKKPLWSFIGLEDARLIKWNDKMYLCGVRRDTTTHGQGRMELSEIVFRLDGKETHVSEVSRFRIPAPGNDSSYCEKNWMPILDQPYHFMKWSNPVEIVKVDPDKGTCVTVFHGGENNRFFGNDQRGGGQVIPFDGGYLALTHETDLYFSEAGKKNATYRHRFTHWSKDWKPIKISPIFSFMDAKIEFACGLAEYKGDILTTFGYQDNAAFITRCSKNIIRELLNA